MTRDKGLTPKQRIAAAILGTAVLLMGSNIIPPVTLLPNYTIGGTLPASASSGQMVYVTNGTSYGDCTAGAGTVKNLCIWDGSAWVPSTSSGGGTTPPLPSSATYGDFFVVRTSATVITIGQNCSVTFPCRATYSSASAPCNYTAGAATATLSGSTSDVAYVYLDPDASCALKVGHTSGATLTCNANCTAGTGISAFPVNSIPIWSWPWTSGSWDSAGTDARSGPTAKAPVHAITASFGDGTNVITTGDVYKYPTATFKCVISRLDTSGFGSTGTPACSITVDVRKKAGAIPTSSDKISASAPATLSSSQLSQDGSLTGWTKTVATNDVFGFSVATVTGCTSVTVQLACQ